MRAIIKFLASSVAVFIITIGLSTSIAGMPGLGSLLNPYDGVYETARLAIHPENITIKSEHVSSKVTILRDSFGVPYIFAEKDEDLFYALGYAHAQDRLWQMDMQRRKAEGKLAEILGRKYVDDDELIRRIGLAWSAQNALEKLRETSLISILRAYSKGVNDRIKQGSLPLEFKLLRYEPSEWTPKDTLAIAKLISWGLSGTLESFDRQELAERLGKGKTWRKLYPEETPYFKPIHRPPYPYAKEPPKDGLTCPTCLDGGEARVESPSADGGVGIEWPFESTLGSGSNNWVVDGKNSETGKPILANDPHLQLPMPSLWYQVYLDSEDGYDTAGVTFPGIPVIMIGTNGNIAWGLTNISADDTDFYVYETNSEGSKYLYDNEWRKFEEGQVAIPVRGDKDVQMTIRRTVHGPVIKSEDRPISLKWTGHYSWTELKAMYRINKADDLAEFKDGLQYWHCPPQNFAYADKDGNIGMFSTGWFPIRGDGRMGIGVQDGNDPKNDWRGFVPFGEVPRTLNPDHGYLSSANQDPVTQNYPYYLGRFFAPGYRGRRIDNLLSSKDIHGIDDFKNYQADIFSVAAGETVPYLLNATRREDLTPLAREAVDILSSWDYEMRKEEPAPLIWSVWEMKFFRNIFVDEYEEAGAQGLPLPRPIVEEKLVKEDPNSIWFDDVNTPEKESRDDLMLKSLEDAVDLIERELGENPEEWKWGEVNMFYFEHLSGIGEFSRGPYPASGGRDTLKVAPPGEYYPDFEKMTEGGGLKFRAKHGQSWKMIASLGEEYLGIYPSGQSSNPLSEHYDDMLRKYLDFEYNVILLPGNVRSMEEEKVESRLIIRPLGSLR